MAIDELLSQVLKQTNKHSFELRVADDIDQSAYLVDGSDVIVG